MKTRFMQSKSVTGRVAVCFLSLITVVMSLSSGSLFGVSLPVLQQSAKASCYPNCNTKTKYPILLVHGWTDNGEADHAYGKGPGRPVFHGFYNVANVVKAYGYNTQIWAVDYDSLTDLETRAKQVRNAIMDLLAATAPGGVHPVKGPVDKSGNLWKINLIGHCAGGYVSRYLGAVEGYLDDYYGNPMNKRVESITTISSAQSGILLFDLLYNALFNKDTISSKIVNAVWNTFSNGVSLDEYLRSQVESVAGYQGEEFGMSLYYESQYFMTSNFQNNFTMDPAIYFQAYTGRITNIYADRFSQHKIPFLVTQQIYKDQACESDDGAKSDSLIHPMAAAGYYVDFDAKLCSQKYKKLKGLGNLQFRGIAATSVLYAGTSHTYMNDSAQGHGKYDTATKTWIPGEPNEERVGWSSDIFYTEVVNGLRAAGH